LEKKGGTMAVAGVTDVEGQFGRVIARAEQPKTKRIAKQKAVWVEAGTPSANGSLVEYQLHSICSVSG
jgi:hypothetical protein